MQSENLQCIPNGSYTAYDVRNSYTHIPSDIDHPWPASHVYWNKNLKTSKPIPRGYPDTNNDQGAVRRPSWKHALNVWPAPEGPKKTHHIFGVLRMNPLFGCWYWHFRSCLLWTPKTGLFRENIITSWFESENSLGWVGWRFCLVVLDFFIVVFFPNAKPSSKVLQSVYIRVDFTSNIMSVCVCTCLCHP